MKRRALKKNEEENVINILVDTSIVKILNKILIFLKSK